MGLGLQYTIIIQQATLSDHEAAWNTLYVPSHTEIIQQKRKYLYLQTTEGNLLKARKLATLLRSSSDTVAGTMCSLGYDGVNLKKTNIN